MTSAEKLARNFHDIYERLAPSFGYETRQETRHFNPDTPNGQLMIAVCGEIMTQPFTPDWPRLKATQDSLREHMAIAKAAQESEHRFRKQVAAALGELRRVWYRRMNSAENEIMEDTLRDVLDETDTTIASLLRGTEE